MTDQLHNSSASPVRLERRSVGNHAAIFRASLFTGGAQVALSVVGVLRAKLAALALGVDGLGANGLMSQACSLIQAIAGLGVSSSGVRTIAAAKARGDNESLARACAVLRGWSWATGLFTGIICVVFAPWLSWLTFGNLAHRADFQILGLAGFLQQLSLGQSALLRGMGRIRELAILNATAAMASLAGAVPCFMFLGLAGIAPALAFAAMCSLACSWWYARREPVPRRNMPILVLLAEGGDLIRVGLAIAGVSVAGLAAIYFTGQIVRAEVGLEGNGYYQAAAGITIVLIGFVLGAMGQDYYPRLIALIHEHKESAAKLIHDQTEMAVLMAAPVLVWVSACAPFFLRCAYTEHFVVAAPAVTWLALGCLGRVISWPLGYALLADGSPAKILTYEVAFSLVSVGLAWAGVRIAGLEGACASFAVHYLLYWAVMSKLINARLGFLPTKRLLGMIALVAASIYAASSMVVWLAVGLAVAVTLASARCVLSRLGPDHRASRALIRVPALARLLGLVRTE